MRRPDVNSNTDADRYSDSEADMQDHSLLTTHLRPTAGAPERRVPPGRRLYLGTGITEDAPQLNERDVQVDKEKDLYGRTH